MKSPQVKEGECSMNIHNVPRVLRNRFKAACHRQGITMKEAIRAYMERHATDVESQTSVSR